MNAKTTTPPKKIWAEIRARDKVCVYCGKDFDRTHQVETRADWDTVEHLNHKSDWDSVGSYMSEGKSVSEIVAICCWSCNTHRGSKSLLDWFQTDYCKNTDINYSKVSDVVQKYIDRYEK